MSKSIKKSVHDGVEELSETLYTVGEEVAHSVTHGLGILAGIVGLAFLVGYAMKYGDGWVVAAVSIFGASIIIMYTASTLYHSVTQPKAKHYLRIFDHCAIYLLIAGTYTPFLLVTFREDFGWTLFMVIWGLAFLGIIFKLFATGKWDKISALIYLGMGWIVVVVMKPFVATLPTGGLILMVAGGLAYTGGVVFYLWDKIPYNHAIWHGFVLAGTVFHYFAIFFYVIPRPLTA